MKFFQRTTVLPIAVLITAAILSFGIIYVLSANNEASQHTSQTSCSDTCVMLGKSGARPNTIAVARGSYVQFNSADGKSHNLSIGAGGEEHEHTGKFYSGEFQADEAWRVQFNDEGTFKFHDHLNPKINIVVVVYTPGKEYRVE